MSITQRGILLEFRRAVIPSLSVSVSLSHLSLFLCRTPPPPSPTCGRYISMLHSTPHYVSTRWLPEIHRAHASVASSSSQESAALSRPILCRGGGGRARGE